MYSKWLLRRQLFQHQAEDIVLKPGRRDAIERDVLFESSTKRGLGGLTVGLASRWNGAGSFLAVGASPRDDARRLRDGGSMVVLLTSNFQATAK